MMIASCNAFLQQPQECFTVLWLLLQTRAPPPLVFETDTLDIAIDTSLGKNNRPMAFSHVP